MHCIQVSCPLNFLSSGPKSQCLFLFYDIGIFGDSRPVFYGVSRNVSVILPPVGCKFCIFGGNTAAVICCSSQCSMAGGT